MKNTPHPSDLELQALSVLWEQGPSTVRDVLAVMPDGKERAYTTILSVMQVMEKKGFVRHTASGRTHVYQAVATRRKVLGPMLRGLVRNVFGGSPSLVVQQLVEEAGVSAEEMVEIRSILDQASTDGRKGKE